jgi:hypothetical protein
VPFRGVEQDGTGVIGSAIISSKGVATMTTAQTTTHELNTETPDAAKVRRNAEYLAKLDKSFMGLILINYCR